MTNIRHWSTSRFETARQRLDHIVGGAPRRSVIVVLAMVLGLASADIGTLAATAVQVEHYFGISKTQLGVLGSITTGVTAVTALPFGALVDRVNRSRLLAWSVTSWVVAMAASGAATSYLFLLAARVFLGLASGVTYPAVASLIGDYFPRAERARVYGWVLSGELIGTGFGVAVAGGAASVVGTWRAGQFALVLPAALLAWWLRRFPEPARGGASRMPAGQQGLLSAAAIADGARPDRPDSEGGEWQRGGLVRSAIREEEVPARESLVQERPSDKHLWQAVWYVLRIPTNAILIVASALGYFFFSGLRFFAIQFAQQHYHVSHGVAALLIFAIGGGALIGVLSGGRIADRLLRRGHLSARIVVPSITFVVAAVLLAPGLYLSAVSTAFPLLFVGAMVFASSNPPLDAARLDVISPRLWGRSQATHSTFRGLLEAIAPVAFGLVADRLFGGQRSGLMLTFLVMLTPLLAAAAVASRARRHYPRDVATADAVTERESDDAADGGD